MGNLSQMHFLRGYLGRLILAACLAFCAIGATSAAFAQEVLVEGAHRVDPAVVRSYFTGTDQAHIDQGVKDLSATGMFSKVSARVVGGHVIVSVDESAIILNRVAFEGNSKIKGDQLAVEVQSKPRGGFSETLATGDIERIKEAYRKFGRGAAKVTYRLVALPNGRSDLVFTIDEGDKTGVREIKFVGNNAVSNYRLHSLMQTSEMNFLSFLKTSDVYDPDRLASDEEAIRKYYMKNGYADYRITNTDVHFQAEPDPGYIITITMEEGPQYHVGAVSVDSHIPNVDGQALKRFVKIAPGDVYNASAVELSTEAVTRDVARQGYAFSEVRPHGDRNAETHEIGVAFTVDDGPKVYIERIDIEGNTRTRDYVIRREFDIGEGDPYNHALIERAERRLNNLGFFKKVHITNRPGSTADRVIVVVEVEDQPTGSFAISGGYSTTDGAIAEVSVTETNFLGRGQYVKLSASEGQYSRGWAATFTEPYFLDQRIAAGFDIYHKETDPYQYALYENWTTGVTLRLGLPVTDEFTFQPHYSVYESAIKIPNSNSQPYDDCTNAIPGLTPGSAGSLVPLSSAENCVTNGEASLALKQAAAQGAQLTSLVGFSLVYNTLDNNKNPTTGAIVTYKQDVAGAGGDSKFLRETFDARYYYPITDDFVGFVRGQAGQINAFGGQDLRIIDTFNVGPTLVRGFAPGGIGPRDISDPTNLQAAGLGGTTYFGGTAEVQFPIYGLPREIGLKGAIFADAGTLFGYNGPTNFSPLLGLPAGSPCIPGNVPPNFTQSNCIKVDNETTIRSSIGASIIWASPLGPIRIDYAYAVTKGKYDQTQAINFSGGSTF
jgi:outer membrane protein insertion porin family